MQRCRLLVLGILTTFIVVFFSSSALAATPGFTITAANVTMSATGSNLVTFTLTSVDGYSGTIEVICDPNATNAPVGATLPPCGQPSPIADPEVYTLAANGTVQGSFPLITTFPPCSPCPVKLDRPRRGFASGLALAGALLIGLGFRRRVARWFVLALLAFGTLAGPAGISACGGTSGGTLTPGVWPYVVQAWSQDETEAVTINVTVPPGIPWTD